MKARLCTIYDIDEISHFAHNQNTKNGQRTSFMYSEEDNVRTSFKESLNNGSVQVGIFNGIKCFGYIQVITDPNFGFGDVVGPFCEVGYENLITELITLAANKANQVEVFKFNLDLHNSLQDSLIRLGAVKQEDNYQLEVTSELFNYQKNISLNAKVIRHEKKYDELCRELYCSVFQDTYITVDSLFNYNCSEYKLVDLILNDEFIGFGYYRINTGYIDFIAIDSKYRRRGLGFYLLSEIIKDQIENYKIDKISLNVDTSNNNALELYKRCGFIISDHFISYHLKRSDMKLI